MSIEWIGLITGAIAAMSYLPQVFLVFKLKSAYEISLIFTILFCIGIGGWLVYGLLTSQLPLILWNGISLALAFAMLYAKLRYGMKAKKA